MNEFCVVHVGLYNVLSHFESEIELFGTDFLFTFVSLSTV